MIDVNSFLLMLVCILSSILLIALIILIVKLIGTVEKINNVVDEFETRLKKTDRMFGIVDTFTDSMALFSDKIVDGITFCLKKIFTRKKGKENDIYEEE